MHESTKSDVALVHQRLDELLATCDPLRCEPGEFWGVQFDLGLAWVRFPVGLGGLAVAPSLQELVGERLDAAGAPGNELVNFVGVASAGPVIAAFGTEEQKRTLLRPTFTCQHVWCQLFSEPAAGSDLANLETSAVRDGDEWVVNGHKVWTTWAEEARYAILLARTHPERPKHRGITFFLVDMHDPGVVVRPLRQISGEAAFSEVFLDDVRVPDAMRVGEPGDGWRVTIGALTSERNHNGEIAKRPRGTGPVLQATRLWRELGCRDPVARDQLMQLWIEAEVIRLTSMRADQLRTHGMAGPEASTAKLSTGLLPQRVYAFCMHLLGARGMLISGYDFVASARMLESNMGDGAEPIEIQKAFLDARGATIGGGTTEMHKNTLAERVLGLPAEPRVDRDAPWRRDPA
jgi:alkylation response protein AidB-like acyl-CoA dehydrogenase